MSYCPGEYWEKRLSEQFDITRTGTLGFSPEYNKWLYRAKIRALHYILKKYAIQITKKSIIDLGCGTGFFIDFYSQFAPSEITGIDITKTSVSQLSLRYPKYSFIQGKIESHEMQELGKFDIVNVFDVLYHLKITEDFTCVMQNIASITKAGGHIFITDLLGTSDIDAAEHVTFRGIATYKSAFDALGIEIIDVVPMYNGLNKQFKYLKVNIINRYDKLLAPILYFLDGIFISHGRSNMKLLVARKI